MPRRPEHSRFEWIPRFPKPYADAVARLRVPSGFLVVALFAWFSRPVPQSLLLGLPVSLLGLGQPTTSETLFDLDWLDRPAGHFGLALGAVAVLTAVVLVYLPAIQLEEQHLRKLFPAYPFYATSVPALWPRLPSGPVWNGPPFEWRLYWKNREYQAAAGLAVGMLFLLWKALR